MASTYIYSDIEDCFEEPWGCDCSSPHENTIAANLLIASSRSVRLYLEKSDMLVMAEQLQERENGDLPSDNIERFLISILAAWGTVLDDKDQPSHIICDRLAFIVELEKAFITQPDSLLKFFVSPHSPIQARPFHLHHIAF